MENQENNKTNQVNSQDAQNTYEPNKYDPESVSVKTYLWDLNNQLFEVIQHLKVQNALLADLTEKLKEKDKMDKKLNSGRIGIIR